MPFSLLLFAAETLASYAINRALAPDGPRLPDRKATGGDYGVPMPRAYGEKVRVPGEFIAQADIAEKKHKTGTLLNTLSFGLLGSLLPGPKYYTYSDTFALLLLDRTDDDPVEDLDKLWATGKLIFNPSESTVEDEDFDTDGRLIYRKWGKNRYFKSLTLYAGHSDQPVDPVLADAVGEDGGYPYSCILVFEALQLQDFGNAIPAIEALLSVKTGQSVASAIEAMATAGGIDADRDLSSTALTGSLLRGYLVNEEASCWDGISPLLPAFAAEAAEAGGQIRLHKRSQSLRATIPTDDMGAYVYGDNPPDKYTFSRSSDIALPQTTSLTFIDPARDYQPNTAATPPMASGNAKSNITTTLPLVLTADEGTTTAAVMQWDAVLGRSAVKFTLTDTWIGLEAGLAYAIPVADQWVPYRVTRKTRGANGIIEVEALSDESVTYSAALTGSSGTMPLDESTLEAETRLVLMDTAIVDDAHDDYGFYIAVGASADYWSRAEIQVDPGTGYETIDEAGDSTAVGDVTGILAAGTTTGLDDTLDTTTVLTVVLMSSDMTLESATDAELAAGKNLSFVGSGLGEQLQFKTATHITGSTWELTDLLRGRNGTDWAIASHGSGEEFALIDGTGLYRVTAPNTDNWGNAYDYRGVSLHQDEADADVQTFTNTGEGKRPYSPVNVMGSWDGSNNLTISWDARSRLNAGGLGIDDQNNFEVQIFTGSGTTLTATGASTVDYSAADQTGDGIMPGDSITGRVRQLSDVNNGRWRDFFLAGPGATLLHEEDDSTPLHLEDGVTPFELG